MGCAASKGGKKKKKGGKGKEKETKKKNYGKKNSPDALRREITDLYSMYKAEKKKIDPYLAEKFGVNAVLNEEREKLLGLLAKSDALKKQREPLMMYTWEKDADDIQRAFAKFSADKAVLIGILATRTKSQIASIAVVFEKKYGCSLLGQVVNDMTTLLGKLITGKETGLCKLLTYRILPQEERDAAFLRDFSNGIGLDDENLLEIVCTRTNEELQMAISVYLNEYGKHLPDLVKSKSSYKNYREFMLKVLECKRDEENKPFDPETAQKYADELYAAGGSRSIGMVPEPFIRIFSTINRAQFESINDKYKGQQLIKDITSKLGGDFELAVLTMCADKYEFFAKKVEKCLKGYSADKDGLCRIFGCLARWECVKVRESYDKMGFKRTLEVAIKSTLKGHYQLACLTLISGDLSQSPMGSDKEPKDDEAEAEKEGVRARKIAEVNYRAEKMIEKGRAVMKDRKKFFRKKDVDEDGEEVEEEQDHIDDDEVKKFYWDGKGRFFDVVKLVQLLEEAREAKESICDYRERLQDEINATKDVYFAITKHCYETETWLRILGIHVKSLTDFIARRDKASGVIGSYSSSPYALSVRSPQSTGAVMKTTRPAMKTTVKSNHTRSTNNDNRKDDRKEEEED